MKKIKDYWKYKLGLTKSLPAGVINSVKEQENNEPLVNIKKINDKLFFGGELKHKEHVLLRKTVADKIVNAVEMLPKEIGFIIYDAYRSLEQQKRLWDEKYDFFKNAYPNETEEQITKRTKAVVADPRRGHGGHQTGGALDLGLCDMNGQPLDMGTQYLAKDKNIRTRASGVSENVKQNRMLLLRVMKQNGFVNYPNEWWHFCYGDRMWAAYSTKNVCFYGLVSENVR